MRVEIGLLGGFTVSIDGAPVPDDRWRRRSGAALVKLLALAPAARLHRERVVDALWPDLDLDTALARLHKAAFFARQALGCRDAVVLRGETVSLFPSATVAVDAIAFEVAADAALTGDADACAAAIAMFRGELLPGDLNEPWSEEARDRLRTRLVQVLRRARRWHDLLRLDPADEQAHLELLREAVAAGDRAMALRRYEVMERNLAEILGIAPHPEAVALRDRMLAAQAPAPAAQALASAAQVPTSAAQVASQADPAAGVTMSRDGVAAAPAPVRAAAERGSTASRHRPAFTETLVERDADLATLLRTVRSALRTGRGSVVLITGEAGSGKSALTRAFLSHLEDDSRVEDNVTVAVGGCDDLLAPRALAPFRDMAETSPGLAAALSNDGQPEDVFPALLRFVRCAPTVVVVEDVHWADDGTLDAIRYLSRRIGGIPAILLLTFRPEDIDAAHPLRGILGGLSGSSVRRIELAPLSVAAVRQLGGVDDVEAVEIHRVTRGNPFFVTEVLDTGAASVPHTVRDAVLARVGRLPPQVRSLSERLAVVPSRAERWLAEALAGDQPGVVAQAERSGVISGGAEYVSFRHELARRAIETSLTAAELVDANREVLDILLRQPRPEPSRIVHHAERAVRRDVLARYGPVAADDAQHAGAHRQAAETARVVLQHAGELDPTVRARLLTRRAYSLYVVNDYDAALAAAESAVSVAGKIDDRVMLAEALLVLSRIVFFARGPVTARGAAGQAVDILEALGDETRLAAALIELARAHSNLATLGIVAQPSPDTVRHAERALALCDRIGRDDLRAQALCYLGSGRLAMGDERGSDDIDRAIAVGARERQLETRVRTFVNAAGGAYRAGRFGVAKRYVEVGMRLAADGEFAAGRYRLGLTAAAVSASAGDWDDAVDRLWQLVNGPGKAGVMAVLARSLLARLLARRGDPDCDRVLDEALRDPLASADSYVAGPLAAAHLEVGWLAGTCDGVPARVPEAITLASGAGHTAMLGELGVYLRRAGHPTAVPPEVPGPWAPALAGRWREAAAGWRELGERYEHAVELASPGADDTARGTGLRLLEELGAHATVRALKRRP